MKINNLLGQLCFIAVLLFCSFAAEASHYRYGNISWNRANTSTRDVNFTVTQSYRLSAFSGVALSGVVTDYVTLNYGDGSYDQIYLTVTAINTTDDWFVGTFQKTHTYAGSATSFMSSYSSCCRYGGILNNSSGNFGQQSEVDLVAGNTGCPISTVAPIVNVVVGQSAATFSIPAVDPDNSALTFALATSAQVGGGSTFTQPTNFSVGSTGTATFNTVGLSVGALYSSAVSITDASGSSTIVDFIMKIVASNTPPTFDYSVTPNNNSTINVNPGNLVTFGVKAACTDVGSTVTLSVVGLPSSGIGFSTALPTTANPVSTTFSWTPTIGQLGVYVITFTATRNGGVQTTSTVTINVSTSPQFISPTPPESIILSIPTGVAHSDVLTAQNPDPSVYTRIFSASIPATASMSPTLPTTAASVASSTMTWTPTAADFGNKTFSYVAKDANGQTATRTYQLAPNSLPSFTSTPVTAATACATYSYTIAATDPDVPYGDQLELMSTTLPSWLSLTDNGDGTGTLSGTPSNTDAGSIGVTLTVEDIWHHSHSPVTQTFNIIVAGDTQNPTITAPGKITINGPCNPVPFASVALGTATASDNCGVLSITNNAPTTFTGSTTVTWTATDINGNHATATQVVEVVPGVISLVSNVSPKYPLAGQEPNTIYLGYPGCATAEDITVSATGGTGIYTYAWTKSTCNNFTNLNSTFANTTSSVSFAPSLSDTCSFNGDNVYQYVVTVTDGLGCKTSQATKVNVVDPYVGNLGNSNIRVCHRIVTRGSVLSQLLTITPSQVAAHLQHGDQLANCTPFLGKQVIGEEYPQEVAVYPNPTTGVFIVEISRISEQADIIITDIQGRLVTHKTLSKNEPSTATFDLTNNAAGMYLIQVRDGAFGYNAKLILR